MNRLVVVFFWVLSVAACKNSAQTNSDSKQERISPKGSYERNIVGIVHIETFDHYTRKINQGYGFYISANIVVTNLDLIKGAYKAKVAIVGTDSYADASGYTAYSIEQNLVTLKIGKENLNYLDIDKAVHQIPDSVAALYRKNKKMYAPKAAVQKIVLDSVAHYNLSRELFDGLPAFNYLHHLVGMVQTMSTDSGSISTLIPASDIKAISQNQLKKAISIYELRNKTNKIYPSHKDIKGFTLATTMGSIGIRLYDQTPLFRDNFIKLVSDNFYDSLLVHRVLSNFLIQTGAADSKYAAKDGIVGWQGPGYDLKTVIVPGLFHKRGAIAASKIPGERNPQNRSEGSQFYIVSGRKYSIEELRELEKDKGMKFSQAQINTYTTIGGAPHLDNDYTVFGEVTHGMDVVDKIASVKTYGVERPVEDIRVLTIRIVRKNK